MATDIPEDAPVLDTRIPEGRPVAGLEYGRHVTTPGWSGYYVRPEGSHMGMAVARQTPADDELVGDDAAIVEAIRAELGAVTTTADKAAVEFGDDGQVFDHPDTGETLAAVCKRYGGRVEYARLGADYTETGDLYTFSWHGDHMAGDHIRHVFADGSAIVEAGEGWDIEGSQPFHWQGAES